MLLNKHSLTSFVLPLGMVIIFTMTLPMTSAASLLGPADDYNIFLFGDMYGSGSDAEGNLAAGGNITLNNYSVGLKSETNAYSLVGGGDVSYSHGSVWNGGIYGGGNVNYSNLNVQGSIVANGSMTSPVDFSGAHSLLTSAAMTLASLQETGSKTINYGTVFFEGNNNFNVFSLTADELKNSVGFKFNVADDAVTIINVSGTYNDFSGFGFLDFNGTGYSGMDSAKGKNILFNFYETITLDISKIGIIGSILAPFANVYGNSAVMNGTLVANSMSGTMQFNDNPFTDAPAPVPEPSTMLLFGAGLIGLAGMGRKRIKSKISPC